MGRQAAVMPERLIEIEIVRRIFFDRLFLGISDEGLGEKTQVLGRDGVAVLGEAFGVIDNDVLRHAGMLVGKHAADIVAPGPGDGVAAARERHPGSRIRVLIGPRPDRQILERPELAFMRDRVFRPGLDDDLVSFLEPGARFRLRHIEDAIFARHATGEAGPDPSL